MPGPLDQLPPDATSLARRVAALERELRELRASRRASNATIGGGDTTITGARIQTASDGARVVLDEIQGALEVFDASDNLTNYVGGPDNIVFNQAGFPSGEFVGFYLGNLILGVGNATGDDFDLAHASSLGILGVGFGVNWQSPVTDAFSQNAFLTLYSGATGSTSGQTGYQQAQLTGDLSISGAAVKMSSTFDSGTWRNVPASWQTPTWGTNWAGTNTLGSMGGFRSLQARQCVEDDVWVLGAATTTGTSGTIGTLPSNMWPPTGDRVLLPAYFDKAGTTSVGTVQVTEAGVINSSPSLGGITPASNTQVFINGRYPLGNLP